MSPRRERLPAVHILHAQDDIPGFVLESTVKSDDVGAVAIKPDL
jgi:hypothetical protein